MYSGDWHHQVATRTTDSQAEVGQLYSMIKGGRLRRSRTEDNGERDISLAACFDWEVVSAASHVLIIGIGICALRKQ
jgi:hypothetical protein